LWGIFSIFLEFAHPISTFEIWDSHKFSDEHWFPFLIFSGLISLDFKICCENVAGFTAICQFNRKIGFAAMPPSPAKKVPPE
jgi:hypothetical protein